MIYMENMGFNISPETVALAEHAMEDLKDKFAEIDRISELNTQKVLAAFHKNRVAEGCFNTTTGYGYDDRGRDTLDNIFADIFHTEAALVRINFVNGTHAISAALFAALKPGDVLVYATGAPYDTIHNAIGLTGDSPGSLKYYGVGYCQVDLTPENKPDYDAIRFAVADEKVAAVAIQRSCGYSRRTAFSVEEIGKICDIVHEVNPKAYVIVDNCYGEFVDTIEPTDVGADLVAGSLIKNPGGGISPTGGYVAGCKKLVDATAIRLTTPGIGGECGCTLGNNRLLYQGIFMAPHIVAQAVKVAVFCARMMELMGYKTSPSSFAKRSDIVQIVELGDPKAMKLFCKGIQFGAPVDSYVTPEPWDMPGYTDQVIMAAGAFIQGSSIELSADGPMREPYFVYLQGGLTLESGKLGIMLAADMLNSQGNGK